MITDLDLATKIYNKGFQNWPIGITPSFKLFRKNSRSPFVEIYMYLGGRQKYLGNIYCKSISSLLNQLDRVVDNFYDLINEVFTLWE